MQRAKPMNEALMKEAERLGINASMYYLIPPKKRERALRLDIEKRRKEVSNGNIQSHEQEPDKG